MGQELGKDGKYRFMAFPLREAQAKDELTALYRYFSERAAPYISSSPLPFQCNTGHACNSVKLADGSEAGSFGYPPMNPEHKWMKTLLKNEDILRQIDQIIPGFRKLTPIEQIAELDTNAQLQHLLPKTFLVYRRHVAEIAQWMCYTLEGLKEDKSLDEQINLHATHAGLETDFNLHGKVVFLRTINAFYQDLFNRKHAAFKESSRFISDKANKFPSYFFTPESTSQNDLLIERHLSTEEKELYLLATNPAAQLTETLAYMTRYLKSSENLKCKLF